MSLYRPPWAHNTGELWLWEPGFAEIDCQPDEPLDAFQRRYRWRFPFLDAVDRRLVLGKIRGDSESSTTPDCESTTPQGGKREADVLFLLHFLLKELHPRNIQNILRTAFSKAPWPVELVSSEGICSCVHFLGGYELCAYRFMKQSRWDVGVAQATLLDAFRWRLESLPRLLRGGDVDLSSPHTTGELLPNGSRTLDMFKAKAFPTAGVPFVHYKTVTQLSKSVAEREQRENPTGSFGTDFVLPLSPFGGDAHSFLKSTAQICDGSAVPQPVLHLAAGELEMGNAVLSFAPEAQEEEANSAASSSTESYDTNLQPPNEAQLLEQAERALSDEGEAEAGAGGSFFFSSLFGAANKKAYERSASGTSETTGALTQEDAAVSSATTADNTEPLPDNPDAIRTRIRRLVPALSVPTAFFLNKEHRPVEYWAAKRMDLRRMFSSYTEHEVDHCWVLSLEAKDRLMRATGKSGMMVVVDCDGMPVWKFIQDMYYVTKFFSLVTRIGEPLYPGQVTHTYIVNVPEALSRGPGRVVLSQMSAATNDNASMFGVGDPGLPEEVREALALLSGNDLV
mmetsp:Transcript_3898/g.9481  ORF Transcript_3898/g.9481 Transcript_3898/m.9481 type:complete len:567 (-) Transcript_3898:758-2458(-)